MKLIQNIDYTGHGDSRQFLDLYLPEGATCAAAFLYIHGGGMEVGCKEEEADWGALTAQNIAVVVMNYRLYPSAQYPDFIEDAAAASAWFYRHLRDYIETPKLVLGGSSAGAYLAMMLCFDPQYLAAHGLAATNFDGYLFDAGQPTTHFRVLQERGLDPRRVLVDKAAPLYHIGDTACPAPTLVLTAEHDMPGRYEQTMLLLQTLRQFYGEDAPLAYRQMKGYEHCAYLREPAYLSLVAQFLLHPEQLTRPATDAQSEIDGLPRLTL